MSDAVNGNPNRQKVRQLLAAVGGKSPEDAKGDVEALEYDWRRPNYFSRSRLNEVKAFAEDVAEAMALKIPRLLRADFDVTTTSISEHFAGEFLLPGSDNEHGDYYLAFGTKSRRAGTPPQAQGDVSAEPAACGLIGVPFQTALAWTTQALGDTKSQEDSAKALSQLEESILLDSAGLFVEALSDSCDNRNFHTVGGVRAGQFPLETQSTRELCKITFSIKKADSEDTGEAYLLMLSDQLESATSTDEHAAETCSPEDISKAILSNLHQMQATVTAQLGSASLTFEELLSLSTDDVLLLDGKADEPIKLIAEDLELFYGQPAKSGGKYAVVITQGSYEQTI